MDQSRRALLATVAGTIALAGCSGGNGGDGGSGTDGGETSATDGGAGETTTATSAETTESTGTTGGAMGATVQVSEHPEYGEILVGPEGMTLYMFEADAKGSGESACTGDCAGPWPPLTVSGSPSAGDGVTASLDAFERSGGETQVAANGWPLYYFSPDESPGDAKGQGVNGFGDYWWVLAPDGTPIREGAETSSGTTSSGGSGAY